MKESKTIFLKRLLYRSMHRGCKETDYIFSDFALNQLENLNDKELQDYEELLNIDDALLYEWISDRTVPPIKFQSGVYKKLKRHNEKQSKTL